MKAKSWYETALICLNGHVITSRLESFPEMLTPRCSRCGETTTSKCPHCQAGIRGYHYIEGVIAIAPYVLPLFCHNCGNPYPWTERKMDAVNRIIDLNKKLKESEKEKLKKAIDELVKETPNQDLAVMIFKKLVQKMGKETWELIKPILIELLSEIMKQKLGL